MRCQMCNDAMGRPTRVELRGRDSALHLRLCAACREALASDPVATVGGDAVEPADATDATDATDADGVHSPPQ
jgi:hypothetical protein